LRASTNPSTRCWRAPCIDRADAADLTQEVFVKVFRGVGSFHGESSLRTWIYRIALREASNQRRWWMRHKQQEVAIDEELTDRESGTGMRLKERWWIQPSRLLMRWCTTENRARVEAALGRCLSHSGPR
jgi:RNA polymerase sigma-70 factor (ECF subfamily)